MQKETITSYVQKISDPRLLEISKECAFIYNKSLNTYWDYYNEHTKVLSAYDIQKLIYKDLDTKLLHSDTKLGVIQKFRDAISSYFESIKEYKINPCKFNSKPEPPTKEKEIYAIVFKEKAIRTKNKHLLLSLKNGLEPIKIKWDSKIGTPCYAIISYDKEVGWQLSVSIKRFVEEEILNKQKLLSIDLGVKRTAATFDGENIVLYSGKKVKSLMNLRNKNNSRTQTKLSRLQKHSREYKRIRNANRKVSYRINNKIKDIVHKYSRKIVDYCVKNDIGSIVCGDCSGIHNDPDKGKHNNQMIVQNIERQLSHYVKYKFENIGGAFNETPEPYTSRACPICGTHNETKTRDYKCRSCNFSFDRDGVGCINIWKLGKNVSFGRSILDVVGRLTRPIGYKYNNTSIRDCLTVSC
jgi:putative transposase